MSICAAITPACRDPLVITVAATDLDDQRLWLAPIVASNVGSCVDIWAPGANILSASTRSSVASDYRSGTSQAAPYVAGGVALFLENQTGESTFTSWWAQILSKMMARSVKIGLPVKSLYNCATCHRLQRYLKLLCLQGRTSNLPHLIPSAGLQCLCQEQSTAIWQSIL